MAAGKSIQWDLHDSTSEPWAKSPYSDPMRVNTVTHAHVFVIHQEHSWDFKFKLSQSRFEKLPSELVGLWPDQSVSLGEKGGGNYGQGLSYGLFMFFPVRIKERWCFIGVNCAKTVFIDNYEQHLKTGLTFAAWICLHYWPPGHRLFIL